MIVVTFAPCEAINPLIAALVKDFPPLVPKSYSRVVLVPGHITRFPSP